MRWFPGYFLSFVDSHYFAPMRVPNPRFVVVMP